MPGGPCVCLPVCPSVALCRLNRPNVLKFSTDIKDQHILDDFEDQGHRSKVTVTKINGVKILAFSLVSGKVVQGQGHEGQGHKGQGQNTTFLFSTYFPRSRSQRSRSRSKVAGQGQSVKVKFLWEFSTPLPRERFDTFYLLKRWSKVKVTRVKGQGHT